MQVDIAPAKACTKPALPKRSKKKYASKFMQAWVTDLTWINHSDRGVSCMQLVFQCCRDAILIRHAAKSAIWTVIDMMELCEGTP